MNSPRKVLNSRPRSNRLAEFYPKPGPMGGRMMREVIGMLRSAGLKLPLSSHILIAISGGPDSVALAHLLVKYGRRVGDPKKMTLIHLNHGWRGKESDQDAEFVKNLGKNWGAKVITRKLKPPTKSNMKGESWENVARKLRKRIFAQEAKRRDAVVFTAHHADDLAETVLWRFFTGALDTHGGGIAVRHGVEIRPFLNLRKSEIFQYLIQEGLEWREDSTNLEGRFLRSRMRLELMPSIEKLFPKAVENMAKHALVRQRRTSKGQGSQTEILIAATEALSGQKARRPHWKAIQESKREIHLPGGWRLLREEKPKKHRERWVLEKR